MPCARSPQAELHVLGEQVHGGVERAEPAQGAGRGGQARGDRPADRAGGLAPGAAPTRSRSASREQRRVHERGEQRPDGARPRDARSAARSPSAFSSRGAWSARGCAAASAARRASESSSSSQSGLSSTVDVVAGEGEPGVARRPEPRVARQHDDLGAAGLGQRGAAVARAAVDHDELRLARRGARRASPAARAARPRSRAARRRPRSSRGGLLEHGAQRARARGPGAPHERGGAALGQPPAQHLVAGELPQRRGQGLGVAAEGRSGRPRRPSRGARAGRTRSPACRGRSPRAAGSRSPRPTTGRTTASAPA